MKNTAKEPAKIVALERRDWRRVLTKLEHRPILQKKITKILDNLPKDFPPYKEIHIQLTARQYRFFETAFKATFNTGK